MRYSAGVVFGLLSSATSAIHTIVIKTSLAHTDNSAVFLAWYINLLCAVTMLPLVVLGGELPGVLEIFLNAQQLFTFAWGAILTVSG